MFIKADPPTIAMLWQRTRAMFARAAAVVGAAENLAALATLTRARHREIAGWLALVETIVRKILLAEAAQLRAVERDAAARMPRLEIIALAPAGWTAGLPARMCATGAENGARQVARCRTPPQLDLTQPHTWRTRFKLAPPRDPLACPESRAPRIRALWGPMPPPPPPPPPRAPRRFAPAPLRLALRLEALRRVIADPAPYAQRLARIMPRLMRRYGRAAERYAVAASRPHWADRDDGRLIVQAIALALLVAPIFANTS